jgi:2-polyprenyl-3-methyl-5-hydroxy-6-metoxy-1,4-benzoquinol methylase
MTAIDAHVTTNGSMIETTTVSAFHRQILCDPRGTVPAFVRWLDGVKRAASDGWPQVCQELRAGALHRSLLEDPFTERAFRKPRGYAGDAVMMDHIYGHASILAEVQTATPVGRGVRGFSATDALPALAVRWRRELVARHIEALVEARGSIDVLAFACGHLRELELVDERYREAVRFVAADADADSLAEVERSYRDRGIVECRQVTAQQLLGRGAALFGQFDFVYTLGLLDYLPGRSAERIVRRLWALVRPNGRFLTANFSVDTAITSYMEAFMDWWLVYRTTAEVQQWTADLDGLARWETLEDPWRQIIYLVCDRGS